jgi:hypothetical protein
MTYFNQNLSPTCFGRYCGHLQGEMFGFMGVTEKNPTIKDFILYTVGRVARVIESQLITQATQAIRIAR